MSGMDVLRKRIARALHGNALELDPENCTFCRESIAQADAVIAALGLTEQREQGCTVAFNDDEPALHWAPRRRYVTPWERIEEDG